MCPVSEERETQVADEDVTNINSERNACQLVDLGKTYNIQVLDKKDY